MQGPAESTNIETPDIETPDTEVPTAERPRSRPAAALTWDGVGLRHASGVEALSDLSLRLEPGSWTALLGPSGCGKSTLLRQAAGLLAPTAGSLDRQVQAPAFVFQEPTLMPWARVFDNVWLPLRLQGLSRAEAQGRVRDILARVGLAEFEQAWPHELSGGMKMRASIARALVTDPDLLLLDEPFAALDDLTRQRLMADLCGWWQARRMTVLFVTHSVPEALRLSQRVVLMSPRPGRILDVVPLDAPYPRGADFLHEPVTRAAEARIRAGLADMTAGISPRAAA